MLVSQRKSFYGFLNFHHVTGSTRPQVSLFPGPCPDLHPVGTWTRASIRLFSMRVHARPNLIKISTKIELFFPNAPFHRLHVRSLARKWNPVRIGINKIVTLFHSR